MRFRSGRTFFDHGAGSRDVTAPDMAAEEDPYAIDVLSLAESDYDDAADTSGEPSFSFSEDDLIPSSSDWSGSSFGAPSGLGRPVVYEKDPEILYSKPGDDAIEPRITVQRTLLVSEPVTPTPPEDLVSAEVPTNEVSTNEVPSNEERRSRRMSRSIAALRRRSKSAGKSSDQASKQPDTEQDEQRAVEVIPRTRSQSRRSLSSRRKESRPQSTRLEEQDAKSVRSFLNRRSSKSVRKLQEGPPDIPQPTKSVARQPSSSPRKRTSTPMRASPATPTSTPPENTRQTNKIAPLPGTILRRAQQRSFNPFVSGKKTDELGGVFRTLDLDYSKFEAKPLAQKASFVRAALIPFLETHAKHPSNDNLAHDDLERRVQILGKWWDGLLDTLTGKTGEQLSALDRPAFLDGVSGLMDRPEWRQPLSEFSPLSKRAAPRSPQLGPQDVQAIDGADYFVESTHQNIRNRFVNYLFRQMSFVVEKMAQKTTPATLVTFCGKCCAYAMVFCPGMADILVRLWDVPAKNVKRAMDSMELAGTQSIQEISEQILKGFPQCMHSFSFSSTKSTIAGLRSKPVLPMGFEKIPWRGAWIDRWCGKDTDLFYIFVKHFHLLAAEFLPNDASKEEIACVPSYVLVRAQILANLDSTLHRYEKSNNADYMEGFTSSNINETLHGDSPTLGLAPVAPNASRLMKANRIIILMRNFLSEIAKSGAQARRMFADCICETIKASVRATSLFDQGACFAICDLLEEVLIILRRYEDANQISPSLLDWEFWVSVFVQMSRSDNTLTMIRLVAFLYTCWPTIISDDKRKEELCFKFLLEPNLFLAHFNHWCPMVRSYFMRLLSWRVARCDLVASDKELEIVSLLYDRILETWAYFKYALEQAVRLDHALPSTAPSNPAPGRRLLIIRTNRPLVHSPLLDSPLLSHSPSGTPTRLDSADPRNQATSSNGFSASLLFEKLSSSLEQSVDSGKRKSTLLRSLSGLRLSDSRPSSKDSSAEFPSETLPASEDDSTPSEPSSRASLYEQRPTVPPKSFDSQMTLRPKTSKAEKEEMDLKASILQPQAEFRFSVEPSDRRPDRLPRDMVLGPPQLPHLAQSQLRNRGDLVEDREAMKPVGAASGSVRYSGRALAEWSLVVNECQNFFERRRNEGVHNIKLIETPIMSPEPFKVQW